MRPIAAPIAALVVAVALTAPALAQPATSRTPNLEGTWTTPAGTGFFAFLHRFRVIGGSTVANIPTFHLSAGLMDWIALGTLYSTQTANGTANELEIFAAHRLLDEAAGAPLSLSLREAYNVSFGSPDGELNLARTLGPVTLNGAARVLGRYQGAGLRVSTGLGASLALTPHLKLAADAAYPLYNPAPTAGEPPVVWGAGLQMAVPYTPHTLSFQVSNAASGSMQGSSTADSNLRYGFDFTVPFTNGQRWLDIFRPAVAAAPSPEPSPQATTEPTTSPTTAPSPAVKARSLEAAKAYFASRCASCHGGLGQGGFGPDLRGVEAKGDGFISKRIVEGSPKGMPPFAGQIAGQELADLIAFVKGL